MSVPREVLEAAHIDPASVVVLGQRIPNWRVVMNGQPAVLKRDWHLDVSDIACEHEFLGKISRTDFPALQPISAFDRRSWIVLTGVLWTQVPAIDELEAVAPWDRLEATLHGSGGVRRFRRYPFGGSDCRPRVRTI
jgi:hypothetical protein